MKHEFTKILEKISNTKRKLPSLVPIFKKALGFDPLARYPMTKELSIDILEEFGKLDGAEEHAKSIPKS